MASATGVLLSAENLEKACIDGANRLLQLCKLKFPTISSLADIGTNFILAVFEIISTGFSNQALLHKVEKSSLVHQLRSVIDCLSTELLGLSLSHISAEKIIAGDAVSVLNLIEILEAVYLHLSSQEVVDSVHEGETSTPPNRKALKRKIRKNSQKNKIIKLRFLSSDDEKCDNPMKSVCRRKCEKIKRKSKDLNNQQSLNFEARVQSVLTGKQSPRVKCRSLSQAYLENKPSSFRDVSICNKSYLLPYNLRKRYSQSKPSKSRKKKAIPESFTSREPETKSTPPDTLQKFLLEFPGFQIPSNTENLMARDYHRHLSFLHNQIKTTLLRKPEILKQDQQAKRKKALLSEVLTKDLQQRHVLRQVREEKDLERKIRFKLRDAQLRSARIKLYFDRYHRAMQEKLQQPNTEEELLIREAFRKMLQHQKEDVRSLCELLKEADKKDAQDHLQFLETLENTYQTQFSLLANIFQEQQSKLLDETKEHNKVTRTRLQKWRSVTQADIHSMQENTLAMIKDIHFRSLDANKFN